MDKKAELLQTIQDIIDLEQNAESKQNFLALSDKYTYSDCDTRIGWSSGEGIEFICKLKKNGSKQTLPTIIDGIENIDEPLYFIFGLNPKVFHFNSVFTLDNDEFLFFNFKLLARGK